MTRTPVLEGQQQKETAIQYHICKKYQKKRRKKGHHTGEKNNLNE